MNAIILFGVTTWIFLIPTTFKHIPNTMSERRKIAIQFLPLVLILWIAFGVFFTEKLDKGIGDLIFYTGIYAFRIIGIIGTLAVLVNISYWIKNNFLNK